VFAGQLGVLLMDSVGAPVSERNLPLPGENGIIALVLKVHTLILFHAPDLVIWGAMKNNKDSHANESEVTSQDR
jgi:hypothetical protein